MSNKKNDSKKEVVVKDKKKSKKTNAKATTKVIKTKSKNLKDSTLKNKKLKTSKTKDAVKNVKTNKTVKTTKSSKIDKDVLKSKEKKNSKKSKSDSLKATSKRIDNKFKNIYDPTYESDSMSIDGENKSDELKDLDFTFKGKEKDLEKEINKEDDIFTDDEGDDTDKLDSDEKKALQGFEQEDIFEGVPIDDPVRMYLKEIGQYDLLTPEQEQILAKDKQNAQDLLRKKKLNEQLPIDASVTIKLNKDELRIVKKGELAQQTLINRNLRLVVSIAKRYIGHGLSLLDLIQEGNLGLTRGIEKFDYQLGYKLSTYVTWWIRQAVSRALADQSKTIRIPVHMVETINRLNKTRKKLTTKLGYEPTVKQIAKEMKMSVEKIEEVMQIALDPISLDKPVGDEDDSIVADFIADQNVMSPEKYAEMVMLKEQIKNLLSTLKERERRVLILRFGIGDDRQRTLEEVGRELKVTRERIRQIEDKALRKLKFKAKNLQNYLDY